jgi:hypothetical protein
MQHSGLDWGILTNGRLWRLYHKDTAHKLDRFYEVNLPELLQTGDVDNFLYFYTFFRRQAFDPGDLSIEALRQASVEQAIDKLACVDGQFVDYRDLAERHLGTIYEGLLEFHLETMDTPESGWTIDLKNEKGERKITGSYYTPDYIVKYMVEETLGPVLRQAVASAKSEQEKIDAVLNVKVLDPAMGSGHFPVEATDYIARFLVEHIEQSVTETGGESELAFWRRRVAQSCIYGCAQAMVSHSEPFSLKREHWSALLILVTYQSSRMPMFSPVFWSSRSHNHRRSKPCHHLTVRCRSSVSPVKS